MVNNNRDYRDVNEKKDAHVSIFMCTIWYFLYQLRDVKGLMDVGENGQQMIFWKLLEQKYVILLVVLSTVIPCKITHINVRLGKSILDLNALRPKRNTVSLNMIWLTSCCKNQQL